MQRGRKSVFDSLFKDEIESNGEDVIKIKGRSAALISKRNELLICRYYYHAKIRRVPYTMAINRIQDEFFLTERSVQDILTRMQTDIQNLNKMKPENRYFKKKFPYLVWEQDVKSK